MSIENNKERIYTTVNVSTLTILKIVAVILLLWFLFMIKAIVAILFIALIFSAALSPWVDWLEAHKLPRWLGVLFIYLVLFTVIGSLFVLLISPIQEQAGELARNVPMYYEKISSNFSSFQQYSQNSGLAQQIEDWSSSLAANLSKTPGGIFSTLSSIVGGIFSFFIVLVMIFYMVTEENATKRIIRSVVPDKYHPYLIQITGRIQEKLGEWLRAQLLLTLVVGVLTYIGLTILGIKYALVLAIIAGVLEVIPYFGPTLSAIPAFVLTLAQGFWPSIWVVAMYALVQWLENNLIVPKIMQKAVGLNPIISLTAFMIGAQIGGVVGMILSIPVATAANVIVKDFIDGNAN